MKLGISLDVPVIVRLDDGTEIDQESFEYVEKESLLEILNPEEVVGILRCMRNCFLFLLFSIVFKLQIEEEKKTRILFEKFVFIITDRSK